MELLKYRTGIDVIHVPYKGVGPAMQDTLAGHVMSMVSNVASAKAHVDNGKLRALAVTSLKRSPALPDVPSMSEAGIKDYEVLNWFGLFAPAGTPKEIVDRLQSEAAAMYADPKTRDMLTGEGADPVASKPADFAAFVKRRNRQMDRGRQGRQHPADGIGLETPASRPARQDARDAGHDKVKPSQTFSDGTLVLPSPRRARRFRTALPPADERTPLRRAAAQAEGGNAGTLAHQWTGVERPRD